MTTQVRPSTRWATMASSGRSSVSRCPALAALLVPMPAVDLAYQLRAGAEILAGDGIPTVDTLDVHRRRHAVARPAVGRAGAPRRRCSRSAAGRASRSSARGWSRSRSACSCDRGWSLPRSHRRSRSQLARTATLIVLGAFAVAAPALALRPQLFGDRAVRRDARDPRPSDAAHPRRLWLIPIIAAPGRTSTAASRSWSCSSASPGSTRSRDRGPEPAGRPTGSATRPQGGGQRDRRRPGRSAARPARSAARPVSRFSAPSRRSRRSSPRSASTPGGTSRISPRTRRSPARSASGGRRRRSTRPAPSSTSRSSSGLRLSRSGSERTAGAAARPRPPRSRPSSSSACSGSSTGRGLAWWALAAPVAAATLAHGAALRDQLPRRLRPLGAVLSSPPRDRRSPLNTFVAALLVVAGVALLPLWRPVGPAGVPQGTLSHAPQGIVARLGRSPRRFDPPDPRERSGSGTRKLGAPGSSRPCPHARFAVDSRIELFPPEVWAEAEQVATASGDSAAILDRYGVVAVVVAADQRELEAALATSPGWTVDYRDSEGSIWLRWPPSDPAP